MTDRTGGEALPGSPPPGEVRSLLPGPGAATPPPAPDVEQSAAELAAGDPQSFYVAAERFQSVDDSFVDITERIRAQIAHIEQVWTGPAAQGFIQAMREINRTVDGLIDTLSAPHYGSLLNQLGDALAQAQSQVGQVQEQRQQERDQFTATPAAANPAAQAALQQQETAHKERSAQVVQQLSNTYYNLGEQFRQFPAKSARGNPVVVDPVSSPAEGGGGPGGGYAGAGGSGGAAASAVAGTRAVVSRSSERGVLGREASTYGTAQEPAEAHAQVNEQGVLVPRSASAQQVAAVGGAAGTAQASTPLGLGLGASRSAGKPDEPVQKDSKRSGEQDSARERSGAEDGDLRSSAEDDRAQLLTESAFDAPDEAELGEGLAHEQGFAAATAAEPLPEGVRPELVPDRPQGPAPGDVPLPQAEIGDVATGAAAGSGGALSAATPSVSMSSPDFAHVPAGPPGTVAGTGATAPGASATAVPPAPTAAPATSGGAGGGGAGMPMTPMGMGGMAGMGGQLGRERFATTLQQEDDDTWDSSGDITGGVLGR